MHKWNEDLPLKYETFCQALASGKTQTDAAYAAGYEGAPNSVAVTASRLMLRPEIKARLQEIAEETVGVAKREEIQRFWTSTMLDDTHDMKDRLKASEHLARSQGMFIQRAEIKVTHGDPREEINGLLSRLAASETPS